MRFVLLAIYGAAALACARAAPTRSATTPAAAPPPRTPTTAATPRDDGARRRATRRLLRHLRQRLALTDRAADRRLLARQIVQVARDANDSRAVVDELQRATPRATAASYRALLGGLGALVPDPHGRFPTTDPTRPRVDWLPALLRRAGQGAPRGVATEAAYSVALARGLAARRSAAAAEALLIFAYAHGGAFRDESGALLRAMGDAAVPTLVRAGHIRHPLAYRMARYADYQLDRLNRSRPDLALAVETPRLRAELLRAYGTVRHPAAVDEVLRLTTASHPVVRQAARWAVLRYLALPTAGATPARRRLRLPGGSTTAEEQDLYLEAGELMRRALVARRGELATARTPASLGDGRQRALELFAAQDLQRSRWRAARRSVAEQALRRGSPAAASAALDASLTADGPPVDRREQAALGHLRAAIAWDLLARGETSAAVEASAVALGALPRGEDARHAELEALRLAAEALRDGSFGALSAWRWNEALRRAPPALRHRIAALRPMAWTLPLLLLLLALAASVVLLLARGARRGGGRRDRRPGPRGHAQVTPSLVRG